jgi:poly-gamma-glutamate capsule biosynthesis protein CapA/YwtB (metallophosphatase superfamily)
MPASTPFRSEAMPKASIIVKTEDRPLRPFPAFAALCCVLALAACTGNSRPPLVLIAGGDCLFDRDSRFARMTSASPRGELRWEGIADSLRASDAFLFNLETTIGSGGSPKDKSFIFRSPERALESLRGIPRPIASLANNHSMDFGIVGLSSTIDALDAAGVVHAGAGMNESEACSPVKVTMDGASISVFSCGVDNDEASFAGPARAGIAPVDPELLARRIRGARASSAAVVVMLHWGREYDRSYAPSERRIARGLVDSGADLVVGSGPHVIRGIERYGGSLILYSVGNLVFDDIRDLEASAGLLARMSIIPSDGKAGKVGVKRFAIAPLRTINAAEGPRAPSIEDARRIASAVVERSPDPRALALSAPTKAYGLFWFEIK